MIYSQRPEIAAWILAAAGLLAVLQLRLLAALLAGLLVFELVETAADRLRVAGMRHIAGRIAALVVICLIIVILLMLAALGFSTLLNDRSESLAALMQKMADVVDTARNHLPPWAQAYLPANAEELETAASGWLRTHAGALGTAGERILRTLVQILAGIVIGGMIALADYAVPRARGPLTEALADRVSLLAHASAGSSSPRSAYPPLTPS